MRSAARGAALAALLVAGGCATRADLEKVKVSVVPQLSSVTERLVRIEQRADGLENADRVIDGAVGGVKQDLAEVRKRLAGQSADDETLKRDVSQLAARLDEVAALADRRAADADRQRTEQARVEDERLRRLGGLEQKVKELFDRLSKLSSSTDSRTLAQRAAGGDIEALRQLEEKQSTPEERLAVADGLFATREFERAIVAYNDFLAASPADSRAPAARLRQGESFLAIKDRQSAHYVLKKLVAELPASPEAREAKKLLEQ